MKRQVAFFLGLLAVLLIGSWWVTMPKPLPSNGGNVWCRASDSNNITLI
jgi:zona occludens toxin (predicted ATPase)